MPVSAPKSANSLNAKLCQQGRHVSLLRAETGLGFKNAGGMRPARSEGWRVHRAHPLERHVPLPGRIHRHLLRNRDWLRPGQVGSNVALSLTFDDGGATTDNFTVDNNGTCCVESGVPWMVNLICNEGNSATLDVVGTSADGQILNPPDVETPDC